MLIPPRPDGTRQVPKSLLQRIVENTQAEPIEHFDAYKKHGKDWLDKELYGNKEAFE